MNKPGLYRNSSLLSKIDAHIILKEYTIQMEWKKSGAKIIDVGCADGNVTAEIIKQYLPHDFEVLLGVDKSEDMVDFANRYYKEEKIKFLVLDVEKELPPEFVKNYDHLFSFFTLHWFRKPRVAIDNFYKLLMEGGECLTTGFARMPFFEAYRILSKMQKWSTWLKNVEEFVSLYYDCKDPELIVTEELEQAGFKNVKVVCKNRNYVFPTKKDIKDLLTAVNAFDIPEEEFENYKQEFVKVLLTNNLVKKVANTEGKLESYLMDYKLIVAYGRKQ